MREVKFKAKSITGEWVYGNFIHSKRFQGYSNEFRIHEQETGLESDIIIETLGEFTGLQDKNGVDIYEWDLLETDNGAIMLVKYRNDRCQFVCSFLKGASTDIQAQWIVVGNIYENPELLR